MFDAEGTGNADCTATTTLHEKEFKCIKVAYSIVLGPIFQRNSEHLMFMAT